MPDSSDIFIWTGAKPSRSWEWLAPIRWRINRLRCMTAAEVFHRIGRLAGIQAERLGLWGRSHAPAPDLTSTSTPWIQAPATIDAAPYLRAADRLAQGKFDVFALKNIDLGSPPQWNRDPKTGIEAPRSFGKLLDYRDPRRVGDIKYLWEPNRHLHLVTLAQAFILSRDRRYLQVIQDHLESWFDACPHGIGPNWSSALEPGLRLINWSLAWQLVGAGDSPLFDGDTGKGFRHRWLESIYQHAEFVRGHFSLYSSANNHLIGEAAGLFIAAITWPHWKRADLWRTTAQALLEREALLQNGPDGVNREQAVSYQQFELDLLLLSLLAGSANGAPFSLAYEKRLESMLEYLASIMDTGGNIPMFGDADDGTVIRLAQIANFCPYRSLLATGAVLFQRGDFRVKARELDDKTRWLLGAEAEQAFLALPPKATLPVRQAFPDGGYYILGHNFERRDEIRLVADAGALGYQTIAAHGHADALAFTLSVGGMEFLIDPGTYAYHTEGSWRAYFRGTAAHNTVRIDGRDQSVPGGNFMWLAKANAGCRAWYNTPDKDIFEGWHDGYMSLADPVMHSRRIILDKTSGLIVIEDLLRMAGSHEVELFFHCSEHCSVRQNGKAHAIHQKQRTLQLRLPDLPGATVNAHHGSVDPIAGWVSRRFDDRQPSPTLHWQARLSGTTLLRSEIAC